MQTKNSNFEIIASLTNTELLEIAKEYKQLSRSDTPAKDNKSEMMNHLIENDHHKYFIEKLQYISSAIVYEVFNRFINDKF
jgi:hypothetical protein